MENLQRHFNEVSRSTVEDFTKNKVRIEAVQKEIPMLQRRNTLDIENLFVHLDANHWNFIDFGLMEHIIRLYGSEQLNKKMERYLQELSLFEQQATASQLIQFWQGRRHTSFNQSDITFRMSKDPDTCLLQQIKLLKKEFCNRFLPPKSELAVLYSSFSCGSLIIKLHIPSFLVPSLIGNVSKSGSYSFFIRHDIESFHIKDILIYPNQVFSK